MSTRLIVTIDTEEEGLWGGTYRSSANTVENIRFIPRFQELCDRYNIRPTYLIDAPVVEDKTAVSILSTIADAGRCEIGAHVHPWCNPPYADSCNTQTYLCNFPEEMQRAKINWLTKRIESRFGKRPTSFRAGRYGLNAAGFNILEQLGYLVDSSVIPFSNYSAQSGPDFSRAPCRPYSPRLDDLTEIGANRPLLEVPVCVGYSRGDFNRSYRRQLSLRKPILQALKIEGLLDRLGILRRIKLSPEQASARDMCKLLDRCIGLQLPVAVLMFHSSSLMPGASPYCKSEAEVQALLSRLQRFFEFAMNVRHLTPVTLTEVHGVSHSPPTTPTNSSGAAAT